MELLTKRTLLPFLKGFVHVAVPSYGLTIFILIATDVWWRQWVSATSTIVHASHLGFPLLVAVVLGIAAGIDNLKKKRIDSWLPDDV